MRLFDIKRFDIKNKRLWLALLCLALLAALAGCGIKTSQNEDKQPADQPQLAAYVYGPEVELAEELAQDSPSLSELGRSIFRLGAAARWDFMPTFGYEGAAAPEEMGDYIYMIAAQAIVWEDLWNIDQENTPAGLSTEYVDGFMQAHFGFTVPHWTEGHKEMDFDGQNYLPTGEWAYMPLYRLEDLSSIAEDIDGHSRVVYEVLLREYSYWPEGEPLEDVLAEAEELLCGDEVPELPEGFSDRGQQQLRFYLDEQNRMVYLGNRWIPQDEI